MFSVQTRIPPPFSNMGEALLGLFIFAFMTRPIKIFEALSKLTCRTWCPPFMLKKSLSGSIPDNPALKTGEKFT